MIIDGTPSAAASYFICPPDIIAKSDLAKYFRGLSQYSIISILRPFFFIIVLISIEQS